VWVLWVLNVTARATADSQLLCAVQYVAGTDVHVLAAVECAGIGYPKDMQAVIQVSVGYGKIHGVSYGQVHLVGTIS